MLFSRTPDSSHNSNVLMNVLRTLQDRIPHYSFQSTYFRTDDLNYEFNVTLYQMCDGKSQTISK